MENEAVTIRDLVRHALRHRPDHLVLGEVRGKEATDLLQALDTGHGGSLTTIHANSAESVLARIVNCAMQDGGGLPWEEICRSVVDALTMVSRWSCHGHAHGAASQKEVRRRRDFCLRLRLKP